MGKVGKKTSSLVKRKPGTKSKMQKLTEDSNQDTMNEMYETEQQPIKACDRKHKVECLCIGEKYRVKVKTVMEDGLKVMGQDLTFCATIPVNQLTDCVAIVKNVTHVYEKGMELTAYCLDCSRMPVFTISHIFSQYFEAIKNEDDLLENTVVPSIITKITSEGIVATVPLFNKSYRVFVNTSNLYDGTFETVESLNIQQNQTVMVKITSFCGGLYDAEGTCKLSEVGNETLFLKSGIELLEEFLDLHNILMQKLSNHDLHSYVPGQVTHGTVMTVTKNGAVIDLGDGVKGVLTSPHYAGVDLKLNMEITAVVLFVDAINISVELSLLPEGIGEMKLQSAGSNKSSKRICSVLTSNSEFGVLLRTRKKSYEIMYFPTRWHINHFNSFPLFEVGEQLCVNIIKSFENLTSVAALTEEQLGNKWTRYLQIMHNNTLNTKKKRKRKEGVSGLDKTLEDCEITDDQINTKRKKLLKSDQVIGMHKCMTWTVSDITSDSTEDGQITNKKKREILGKSVEEVDESKIPVTLALKDEKSDCSASNKMKKKKKKKDLLKTVDGVDESCKPLTSTLIDKQFDYTSDNKVTNQEKITDSLKSDDINISHTNPNTSKFVGKMSGMAHSKHFKRCLDVHAGFAWGTTLDQLPVALKQNVDTRSSDDDEDDDKNDDYGVISKKKKRLITLADKRESARQEEEQIRKTEERLLDAEKNPLSADDFDRLVMSYPNCSRNWIKFMAYHLQTTEIVKARTVARRALNTISFREEQEKLNVWMALLNLENLYGTPESFEKTFHETLQMNDPQKVYFQAINMFSSSEKIEELDKLVPLVTKKYKHNKDAWILAGSAYMHCGKVDKSRNLMQKALTVLEKKYHIEVLVKFALLENEMGSQLRADTIFENILTSYPKRCDVWCVYVDMLVKSKNLDQARQVLDRAVIQKLPTLKMKILFKKYLKFEQDYGTPEGVEKVREMARMYIDSV